MRVLFSLLLLFGSLLFLLSYNQEQENAATSTNVLIFLFVNINILFLLVSAFLVGREIVKLAIDRRRNLLGSRLRLRLIVPFLGLTAIPLVLLFILASGFLNRAFEGWFQSRIEASHDASVLLAKSYYEELSTRVSRAANDTSSAAASLELGQFRDVLDESRRINKLFSLALYRKKPGDDQVHLLVRSVSPISVVPEFKEPRAEQGHITKILNGSKALVNYEGEESRQFLRVYTPVLFKDGMGVLVVSHRIDPDITESFQVVRESYNEYRQLKLFRNPLRSGYLLTFSLVAGMILFAALWMVVQIARGIVDPIERLVRGTQSISRGDYEIRIDPGGDDEIGYLITSFNQMARELTTSRHEAERQRILVESILTNLTVGVVTVDRGKRVVLSNQTAANLLGSSILLNISLEEILPESIATEVFGLLEEVSLEGRNESFSAQCTLTDSGREVRLIATAVAIRDIEGRWIYTLLLFDDITEMAKAQQMIAWREVARRIAHEIKNPLTPLKLSAQRLQRKANKDDDKILRESTQTIVEHVESIKRLADEFSNFARMPTAEFEEVAVETVVTDVVTSYADSCGDVQFQIICDTRLPTINADPEQLRRVLVNLVDNAVSSTRTAAETEQIWPKVTVIVTGDRKQRVMKIEVADNGIGIADRDRSRVFDPYFTRKKGGTGLGLAIVSSVIAEHRGTIRALPNLPRGAKFLIELPMARRR
jgi:two-component system nitrogen regulation sensor histidine kinase NtrY